MKRHLPLFEPKEADKLSPHRPYDHKIELLPDKEPGFGPLYGMSRDELLVLEKYLKENLSKGFIRSSQSDCSSPVLFVKKPGGGLRFCVDYRGLNAITKKNRYPMPLVTETLDRLCKAKYYTKIDIMAAFNRLRMSPGSEKFTAFRTRFGLFEYLVMPFGLCNAPASWQHFINDILREHLDDFCTAYADDILIYSNTRKEHIEHCHWVLDQLEKAGLTCDIEKCEFCVQEVKYLGLIITTDGIKMDPEKIAAIVEWETPNSVKEIQAFLGFANFYRRFIRKFSKIAGPLNDLTHKDRAFKWTQECQKAFEELKIAFTTAPILKHFDPDAENIVETDASDERLGGVLSQYGSDGLLHPVAFFSKKMIPAECNYEIYDKELLAIIRAFEEWRPELEGSKFPIQVITDHKNLEYFMSSKLLNRRQARWSEYLSRFNFKISYRSGKLNNAADSLSRAGARPKKGEDKTMWQTVLKQDNLHIQACSLRNSVLGDDNASSAENAPSETSINDEEESLEDQFSAACAQDKEYQQILEALRTGIRTIKGFPLAECTIVNDQIQYRAERTVIDPDADEPEYRLDHGRLLVPNNDELRLRLISLSHDTPIAGHPGANKTYEILSRKYFWINMVADIKQFTRNCHLCRRVKPFHNKYSGALRPLPVPEVRWQDISIDFIVKLPKSKNIWGVECENMMVVVDRLSKQTHIEPIDELTPERVAQVFYNIPWRIHGLPESIVSDRGTQFVSHFWKQLTCRLRVMARLSTAYHPETDGQTEIRNFAIEGYLRAFCAYLQDDWALWTPSAEFAINNHISETTQATPFFANSDQNPRMGVEPPRDLTDMNLTTRQRRLREHADEYATKMDTINAELRTQMTWAQANQERFANAHREHAPKYAVGDPVWLDTRNMRIKRPSKKLGDKNDGPFPIKAIHGFHAYELELPGDWTIHPVFHTSLLRPDPNDPLPGQIPPPPLADHTDEEGNQYWEIEQILATEVRANRLKVLVKWTGYRPGWEPMEDIVEDAGELMKEFYEQHPGAPGADSWQQYTPQLGPEDLPYEDNSSRSSTEELE